MQERDHGNPLSSGSYNLKPLGQKGSPAHEPRVIRFFARLISFLFHPLFIPGYIAAFLLFVHPYAFSGFNEKAKMLRFASVVLLTAFFPAFTVFLLRRLGFIESIFLRTQKERIIPYVASMFFFFWIYYVSRNLPNTPPLFKTMLLGVFLGSIAALMANIYFKVSMHGIAMGGLVTFFLILALFGSFPVPVFLSISILIAGLVCSARLLLSDHQPFEVYAGFFLGVICQTLAMFFA
jgi:hypothetical protein